MIIVRLHLLLVPPQRPDAEKSNSDESVSSQQLPTVLTGGVRTEIREQSLSGALKEVGEKKANCPMVRDVKMITYITSS